MPLPLGGSETTGTEPGHSYRLPLPGWDSVRGMYYPGADILYVSADRFDWAEASYPEPVSFNRETIQDRVTDAGADTEIGVRDLVEFFAAGDEETFYHEFGHASLTKSAAARNVSLVHNCLGAHSLIGMMNAVAYEDEHTSEGGPQPSGPESELGDEWWQGMAAHTLRHNWNQQLAQNLAAPVQESFAWVAQAYYADAPATDALLDRLDQIETVLEQLGGWTLDHPGYDPLVHRTEGVEKEWLRYLWSIKQSALSAALGLFRTLGEEWAFTLVSRAAKGSLNLHFAGREIPDRMTSVPVVPFTNAMWGLYDRRHHLAELEGNGASLDTVAGVFDEWVGYGTVGAEAAGSGIIDMIGDTGSPKTDPKPWIRSVRERIQHPVPSCIFIEEPRTDTVRTFVSEHGASDRFLLLSLLRWQFTQSLRRGTQRILDQPFTPLLEAFARRSDLRESFEERGVLTQAVRVFEWLETHYDADAILSEAVELFREEHRGVLSMTGELTPDDDAGTRLGWIPDTGKDALGTRLRLLHERPYRTGGDVEGPALVPSDLVERTSLETYVAQRIDSMSQFSGVSADTERLDRIRNHIRDAATDREDPLFPARVYGLATVNALGTGRSSQRAWARRLFDDFRACRDLADDDGAYLGTFLDTAFTRILELGTSSGFTSMTRGQAQDLVAQVCSYALETARAWELSGEWLADPLQERARALTDTFVESETDRRTGPEEWCSVLFSGAVQAADGDVALLTVSDTLTTTAVRFQRSRIPADVTDVLGVLGRIQGTVLEHVSDSDAYKRFCRRMPETLFEEMNPETAAEWIPAFTGHYIGEVVEQLDIPADAIPTVRTRVYLHGVHEALERYEPAEGDAVIRAFYRSAAAVLPHSKLTHVVREPLVGLTQRTPPSAAAADWHEVLRRAVAERVPEHELDFLVTLYGNTIADLLSDRYSDPAGEPNAWVRELCADLQAVCENAAVTMRAETALGAVLGSAAARLTKYGALRTAPGATNYDRVLAVVLERARASDSPYSVFRFGGWWLGYLTLYDEVEEGGSDAPVVYDALPIDQLKPADIRYPAAEVLGRGLQAMTTRAGPNSRGAWHRMTVQFARWHARHAPNREAFLAAFFGSAIGALAERFAPGEKPQSLRLIFASVARLSGLLPDAETLSPALYVDVFARLGPNTRLAAHLDDDRRRRWQYWVLERAATVDESSWADFRAAPRTRELVRQPGREAAFDVLTSYAASATDR